jgi:hypothetical protein
LLLSELLRYTPSTHADYGALELAEASMRKLVVKINAQKRKVGVKIIAVDTTLVCLTITQQ